MKTLNEAKMQNLKQDLIKKINAIKQSHLRWYANAEAMISGYKLLIKVPKSYTDCKTGQWLYGEGYFLNYSETFNEIENIHIKLHETYLKIYRSKIIKKNWFKKKSNLKIIDKNDLVKLKGLSDLLIEKFDFLIKSIENEDEKNLIKYKNLIY